MKENVRFKFRLFIAEDAANSVQAIANLRAICKQHVPDQHDIELVDVLVQPQRALAEKIFMTPTLVKVQPGPARRLVGNLSETELVVRALGLTSLA